MTSIYNLSEEMKKKYKFDFIEVNGWFGYYSEFNKYMKTIVKNGVEYFEKVNIKLTDKEIDMIIKSSI